ncbi:NifX-associated nitrogen fixation protein [Alteraurantiacibacter aquimixticola]|uniref:NifX-associated nitrogen fixation protein n=1 Tax=Alteraurantiacibacter aquimixticola TaxID=2489173 RepID=A0A4T3F5G9_9SPHN|nr:NifX-associated nitrogen fixation protein [Alteraurantiacibacter aquimixticola]TIX51634.1 NifX-associated nitrogen fixation protein [Alteraurantiacibacter aquimixticola]
MSETTLEKPVIEGFAKDLVAQIRAEDTHGSWDRKSDMELLEPFIVDKEKRKLIPIIGDPDPDTLWRLELYYGALCLAIEKRCGKMVSPMMKMSHEGFGRMVLICGRLVVLSKSLRDVHRFGFLSMEKLNAEAEKVITSAIAMIERFPEVADY